MTDCLICEKSIEKTRDLKPKYDRALKKFVTCSPECSRIYTEASKRIRTQYKNLVRKLEVKVKNLKKEKKK